MLVLLTSLLLSCSDVTFNSINIIINNKPLVLELAVTRNQQHQGLMFRSSLPDNSGMLFAYDTDKIRSFWMKNTSIPLSLGYINAEGSLQEIYDMEPYSRTPVTSSMPVRYVMELNKGTFAYFGIKPGDKVFTSDMLVLITDTITNKEIK